MMNYNNWDYGRNAGDGIWGVIFMFFMTLLIVSLIVVFIRHLSIHSASMHHHGTALDLLDKRYARGEIEKKEYEEKRKDLGG